MLLMIEKQHPRPVASDRARYPAENRLTTVI